MGKSGLMDGAIYEFENLPRASAEGHGVQPATRPQSAPRTPPLIGVIRNPRSHRNKGHMPELADSPNVLTRTPRTREDLAKVLADFAKKQVDAIAVDGGDGTVRDVLTCGASVFGEHWPPLIVLPKGKTNALAVDLGLPRQWSLPDALRSMQLGHMTKRRPLLIDQPDSPTEAQAMGFILGSGIFTTATQTGQTAHRLGAFNSFAVGVTAAFGVLQALFGIGKSPWRTQSGMIIRDAATNQPISHSRHGGAESRYAMVFSTLDRFPLNMRLFGQAQGIVKYALIDAPLRRVVAMVPLLMAGWDRPFHTRLGIHRGTVDEAIIELEDRFVLDGEAFPPGTYRLRPGPQLHFIVP